MHDQSLCIQLLMTIYSFDSNYNIKKVLFKTIHYCLRQQGSSFWHEDLLRQDVYLK